MPPTKQPSKQKRRSKALPVLGAAGLSLSLAGTASAVPGGPAGNLPTSGNGDGNQVFFYPTFHRTCRELVFVVILSSFPY